MLQTLKRPFQCVIAALPAVPFATVIAVTHDFNPPGAKAITPAPNTTASVGKPVAIQCTLGFIGSMKINHNNQGADAYLHANSWQLPFEIRVDGKSIVNKKLPGLGNPPATWTESASWTPGPAHIGKTVWFECIVDPQGKVKSSSMKTYVKVGGSGKPTMTLGTGTPQTYRQIKPIMPTPALMVTGTSYSIDPACSQPYKILTVTLKLRNSGGPLAAGKGTVFLKEYGGASLSSAGIYLPAFGPNETRTMVLTAGTTKSLMPKLPGNHIVKVILNPQLVGGKPVFLKPATPTGFTVTLPANYCQPARPGRLKLPSR